MPEYPATASTVGGRSLTNKTFLAACRGEPVPHTPVWFMRQAGRSLPEYRAIRGHRQHPRCHPPARARRRDHAAAGAPLRGRRGDPLLRHRGARRTRSASASTSCPASGPVVANPFERAPTSIGSGRSSREPTRRTCSRRSSKLVLEELDVPLIGFAGAPFTVASYLIEGGPSRTYAKTKALMYGDPELWAQLMDRLADLAHRVAALAGRGRVQRPCSCSTAGPAPCAARDYERYVLPASRKVFDAHRRLGVPRIHFGVGTGELLGLMAEAGADVVGVDWRVPLDDARRRVGGRRCRATSTRPCACAPWEAVADAGPRRARHNAATPATSSTSATACCPRPIPTCLAVSSTSCTSIRLVSALHVVVLGGGISGLIAAWQSCAHTAGKRCM